MSAFSENTSGLPPLTHDIERSLRQHHRFKSIPDWELTTSHGYSLTVHTPDHGGKIVDEISIVVDKSGNFINLINGSVIYPRLTLDDFNSVLGRLCSYNINAPDDHRAYNITFIVRGRGNNSVVVENREDGDFFSFPFFQGINYRIFQNSLSVLRSDILRKVVVGKVSGDELTVIIEVSKPLMEFMHELSSGLTGLRAKSFCLGDIFAIKSRGPEGNFAKTGFKILIDLYSNMWPVAPPPSDHPIAHHHIHHHPSDFSKYHHAMPGVVSHPPAGRTQLLPDSSPTDDTVVVLLHGKSYARQIFMEDAEDQYGKQFYRFPFFGNRAYSEIVSTLSRIPGINFDFPKHYKIVHLGKNAKNNNNEYAILVHAIDQKIADGVKGFIQSYTPFVTNRLIFNDQEFSQIYQSAAMRQRTISITAAPIITNYIDKDGNLKF